MSELPSISTAPFLIAVEPIGPITGSPFASLGEAVETARALQRGDHIIRSISDGEQTLEGAELRKALGPVPPRPSLFRVSATTTETDMFAWNVYSRSDCHRSLGHALAPDAVSALRLMGMLLTVCEDQRDPAATHYLERGNARVPEARLWLRAA